MKNRGSGHSVSAQLLLVVMTLATAIAFFSVQSSSLTANAAVTVLPGNGGTLPLVNQLVIKQDDGAFQGVTTSAGSRATITPDDESQKVLIKDVKDSDTVTATYGTVGTFHGKAITAKVTYTHITNHNEDHKAPGGVGKNDVKLGIPPSFSGSILISNVAQTNVSYAFYYADTKAAVDIQNAFITLSSLDGPVAGNSTGFEYTAYLGGGDIYTVENSIVKQIANPLGGSQLVMAGQSDRDPSWPYASATGATFAVSGSQLDFIYGTTRVNNSDHWLQPVFAISTITLGAPAIAAPTLSATQSDSDKQSQLLNYEVKQKVNVLDQDLMTKYKDWSEALTIPSNATYVDGEVVDDSGNALSKDAYQLAYDAATHKVKWTLTAAGIAKLPFKGETYHFKARVKFGTDVTDQSKVTAVATTVVDKQSKDSNTVSTTLANQREITLHHYMTDSTDKIAPDEKVKVSYGKPYSLKSKAKTVTGYKYNDKLDVATTGTATNKTGDATMYYDPLPYNVHVNYLLEDGQKLDELDVEGLYGDTYTTEATDFEDLYTLDTDRLPGNAQDTVTEKPITVNYCYKPTTGQWVDVGNQSSILTRKDYKNQVRSVSQNYANGSGFTVKYNMDASQVAITASDSSTAASSTSQVFDYGSKYTYQISKNEQMTFKVDDQGAVTVTRTLGNEQTLTTFDKSGKLNTQTTTANNNGTLSKQVDAVDGLRSVVTAEKYDLNLTNGLKVVATKNINLDGTSSTGNTTGSTTGTNSGSSTDANGSSNTTSGTSSSSSSSSSASSDSSSNASSDTSTSASSSSQSSGSSSADSNSSSSTTGTDTDSSTGNTSGDKDDISVTSPFDNSKDSTSALGTATTSSNFKFTDADAATPNDSPITLSEDSSFEEGEPINTPVFGDDEDVSPNNNPSSDATPLSQAASTQVDVTQDGRSLYSGELKDGDDEKNLYVSPDTEVEVDAGSDADGFYVDTFDGDKGMAYTMGAGYEWAAEANDVSDDPDADTDSSEASSSSAASDSSALVSSSPLTSSSSSSSSSSSATDKSSDSTSSSSTKDSSTSSAKATSSSSDKASQAGSAAQSGSSTPTTKANKTTASSQPAQGANAASASSTRTASQSASQSSASQAKQASQFKKDHPILGTILPQTNSTVAYSVIQLGLLMLVVTICTTLLIRKRGRH